MPFVPFALERWQSTWEHRVRINLSESGVHALTVAELLALAGTTPDELLQVRLGYGQSDGSETLRAAIAALYPGATADHVTVTVGSAEANFCACWSLFREARRVVIVAPTYMQIWGLAENFRARVKPVWLDPARGWEPDPDQIRRVITRATDVVVVTDPNNPTGHVLSAAARTAILERVRASGAWLLVDEVYQGAEHQGPVTPTWFGTWERTVVVNGLSKAYGLPGLRIGWIVSPHELRGSLLERHDYTVIGPGPAADYLARCAIGQRDRIFARTRDILHTNYPVLAEWLASFGDTFAWTPPDCGAICFARYREGPSSLDLVERVRAEQDILLVPGDHFNMPGWLRLGYGNPAAELRDALAVLEPVMRGLLR